MRYFFAITCPALIFAVMCLVATWPVGYVVIGTGLSLMLALLGAYLAVRRTPWFVKLAGASTADRQG